MPDQDFFPLYDANLDTEYLDIFQPLPLQPYECDLINRSSIKTSSSDTPASVDHTPTLIPSKVASTTINLYCKECKKKFNNDATMQNHLKSAKHLAAVKKVKGNGKGFPSSNKIKEQEGFINPATTVSLQKMETIPKMSCHEAEPAYLDLAKEFYKQKRPLYTANALAALISLNLKSDTYWIAQLTLARIYCLYNKQMNMAYDIYLSILEQKWGITKDDIIKLSKNCGISSVDKMMDECRRLAQHVSVSPILLSLLKESAAAFAQVNTTALGRPGLAEKISIILYGLAFTTCDDKKMCFSLCPVISKIYEKIGLNHYSMDVKLMYADYLAHLSTIPRHTPMLLYFSILLEATKKDDYFRVAKTNQHIQASNGTIYPELLLLSKISEARRNMDHRLLAHELKLEVDHIELKIANGDSRLLLVSSSNSSQLDYLDGLRQCLQLV